MSIRLQKFAAALVGAGAVALGGCAGHSDFMTKAASTYASSLSPESATIVFFRDSGVGSAVNFAIMDQAANFLGDSVSQSDFSVQLPPGRYFLVAKGGEGTDAVQAEVEAGRVYYVRVAPRMGVWLARVELDPIKPGEQEWARLGKWLERTNHLSPLVKKVPVELSGTPLPDWAARAWGSLSVAEQAARTIAATDGLAFSSPAVSSRPLAAAR